MLLSKDSFFALACILTAACSRAEPPPKRTLPAAAASSSPSLGVAPADECAASEGCRESGACERGAAGCQPSQLEHCLRSAGCQRDGKCRLSNDGSTARCGSETHADCAGSTRCRDEGHCFLSSSEGSGNGSCIPGKLRTAQQLPLTEKRHGLRGVLRVLLDSRIPASALVDARSFLPLTDEPIANASLRLESPEGTVLDELTLYPVTDVTSRSLGSLSETFFATEHVACIAGRFCGWRTRFFELANGKIQRLRALGPASAQRDVETTASFAARWTLKRGAKPGARDILCQEEDPVKSAWVERRFFYADSHWRFSEREAPTGDPQMLAEPGDWSGRID
jgi:hypothetical protein